MRSETIMMVLWRPPSMRSLAWIFASAVVISGVVLAAVGGETAPPPTLPSAADVPDLPATVPPNDPAVQAHPPGCAAWTDRCVTCQREAGKISCSNIGIACQPQAVECVRSEPAEEKKKGN